MGNNPPNGFFLFVKIEHVKFYGACRGQKNVSGFIKYFFFSIVLFFIYAIILE